MDSPATQSTSGTESPGRFKFDPKFTWGAAALALGMVIAIVWLGIQVGGANRGLEDLRRTVESSTNNIATALGRLNPVPHTPATVAQPKNTSRREGIMDFEVHLLFTPQPHTPRVSVVGLPARPGAQAKPNASIFAFPDDAGAIVRFNVEFPLTQRTVDVLAHVSAASGADVSLLRNDHVVIQLRHGAAPQGSQPQCTVSCPQSGKSASGPGKCIECTNGTHTVRICC
jgi:hypothetical protein